MIPPDGLFCALKSVAEKLVQYRLIFFHKCKKDLLTKIWFGSRLILYNQIVINIKCL